MVKVMIPITKNIPKLNNVSENQVKVEDIIISYKKFGNGDPLLLIIGYSGSKLIGIQYSSKNYLQITQS